MSTPPAPTEPLTQVRSEPQRDYLRVVITGRRSTPEASIAVWREVGRQVVANSARRVMVVSQLTGLPPTPQEQELIIKSLVGCGFEGVRTAFVVQDAMLVSAMEHGEIYSRELGQETRVFGSQALAEVWLRHGI